MGKINKVRRGGVFIIRKDSEKEIRDELIRLVDHCINCDIESEKLTFKIAGKTTYIIQNNDEFLELFKKRIKQRFLKFKAKKKCMANGCDKITW